MLSNWIADVALARAREWLDYHYDAKALGSGTEADRALLRSEWWDDVRMWADGLGSWSELRAKRDRLRRRGRPFVDVSIAEISVGEGGS